MNLAEMNIALKLAWKNFSIIKNELLCLRKLKDIDVSQELDTENKNVVAMILEKYSLDILPSKQKSVNSSSSSVPNNIFVPLGNVMEQPMLNVAGNIKISKPTKIDMNLMNNGKDFTSSISHNGVIAICSKTGDKYKLQITSLKDGRVLNTSVENRSTVGFYDNKIILITQNEVLRERDINSFLSDGNISKFKLYSHTGQMNSHTDTSQINRTKVLFYAMEKTKCLRCLNLSNKSISTLNKDMKISHFVPFVSANIQNFFLLQDAELKNIYSLNYNGQIEKLYSLKTPFRLDSVVSPSNIKDIVQKSVLINEGIMYKNNNTLKIDNCPNLQEAGSIVRVDGSLYIAFDPVQKCWVSFRVATE